MTEKQVLAALKTNEQKERAKAIILASQRFGKKSPFDKMKDEAEVLDYVVEAVKTYKKRKELESKAAERKAQQKADIDVLVRTYKDAIKNGSSHQEVIDTISGIYKEKHNARIREQIEALKAQLI